MAGEWTMYTRGSTQKTLETMCRTKVYRPIYLQLHIKEESTLFKLPPSLWGGAGRCNSVWSGDIYLGNYAFLVDDVPFMAQEQHLFSPLELAVWHLK